MKTGRPRERRGLCKSPNLSTTCLICRRRIATRINLREEAVLWEGLSLESFFTLFAVPEGHDFLKIFLNRGGARADLCMQCKQDVYDLHFVLWQLKNFENKLHEMQNRLYERIKLNYDAIPVPTLFSPVTDKDVLGNLDSVGYDEVVKVLFEVLKENKSGWSTQNINLKWKRVRSIAKEASLSWLSSGNVKTDSASPNPNASDFPNNEVKQELDLLVDEKHALDNPLASPETDSYLDETITPSFQSDVPIDNQVHKKKRRILGDNNKSTRARKRRLTCKGKARTQRLFECKKDPGICEAVLTTKSKLKAHIKECHDESKIHICDFKDCTMQFKTRSGLESHRKRVHFFDIEDPDVCDICETKVPKGGLKKHHLIHHVGVAKFSCDRCSKDFNDEESLHAHEKLHEHAKLPFTCVVCEIVFTNSKDLKAHVSSNHMLSGFKCAKCGIMKPNEFLLSRHMKIHDRELTYVCECGKSFGTRGHLTYHKQHHHQNAGQTFPCEICGKTFLYMKNAVRHLVTHQEDKPFKCKICPKTFNYSHLLKKHEEIHSGTKNYSCEICGKRFRQRQNLTQHMRTHRPKPSRQVLEKKSKKDKAPKKKPEKLVPAPVAESVPVVESGMKQEEVLPIILNIQGSHVAEPIIIETSKIETVECQQPVTGTAITFPAEPPAIQQYELVNPLDRNIQEIQFTDATGLDQTTTTVVFLTTDANFQWIA